MNALIIIPAFNEEDNIEATVNSVESLSRNYKYVVINDCSTDNTRVICEREGYNHINLLVNQGFSGAVQTGYKYAWYNNYDIATQLDGDGQHPASKLSDLIDFIEHGEADYVIGSRFMSNRKPWTLRMLGSRLISMAILIRTGKWIKDSTSGMRALNRVIIENFAANLNFIAEPDTLVRVLLSGYRVIEVPIDIIDRSAGTSHFKNPLNQLKYMLRILVSILFLQKKGWK